MDTINPISSTSSTNTKYFLLTVDVEDWFQVENFKPWIPFSTWDSRELRVEQNVNRLLDLLDSCEVAGKPEAEGQKANRLESYEARMPVGSEDFEPPSFPASQLRSPRKPKATFFVLGWLAERLPHMVREIQARGHEVASHGYNHEMPNSLSLSDLKNDLIKSKKLLEDIIGAAVTGYRAPSFAINDDILKIIGDCGYHYDSSYNSFSLHGRYGSISLNGSGKKGIAHRVDENFHELPISNLRLLKRILPFGGGGYFRLLPWWAFRIGVKSIVNNNRAYLFYIHPWEIDPGQQRVEQASVSFKFRHYINLSKTESRLKSLIENFDYCQFVSCRDYLNTAKSYGT